MPANDRERQIDLGVLKLQQLDDISVNYECLIRSESFIFISSHEDLACEKMWQKKRQKYACMFLECSCTWLKGNAVSVSLLLP